MKKRMRTAFEKFFLTQRNLIETVIDQLKSVCHIEHSRHRSPWNFLRIIMIFVKQLGLPYSYC